MPNAFAEPLIGVINAGSSSLKFSFYEGETRLLSGQVDGIGVRPAAQAGPDDVGGDLHQCHPYTVARAPEAVLTRG